MTYTITFNELRKIKDMLPHGSMQRIAEDLGISTDTVRNYFGADNYDNGGSSAGIHVEQGPDGGLVVLASNPTTGITITKYNYRTPCKAVTFLD